jgi:hypothetical protein
MIIWVSATEPRRITAGTWSQPMQWFYSARSRHRYCCPIILLVPWERETPDGAVVPARVAYVGLPPLAAGTDSSSLKAARQRL